MIKSLSTALHGREELAEFPKTQLFQDSRTDHDWNPTACADSLYCQGPVLPPATARLKCPALPSVLAQAPFCPTRCRPTLLMLCSPADRRGEGPLPVSLSCALPIKGSKAQGRGLAALSRALGRDGHALKNKDFNVKTLCRQQRSGGLKGKEEAELHSTMVE